MVKETSVLIEVNLPCFHSFPELEYVICSARAGQVVVEDGVRREFKDGEFVRAGFV